MTINDLINKLKKLDPNLTTDVQVWDITGDEALAIDAVGFDPAGGVLGTSTEEDTIYLSIETTA